MENTNERPFERVHFIGIGGAGMSGIALVLHQRGYQVTGSDLKASRYTRALVAQGIDVTVGHTADTIDRIAPEVVVISTAIPETNPELARARELGCEVWHRAKMLSYLSRGAITVACAGTHGKTTTSSLAATMLERMGEKPTFLIGGIVDGYETNGSSGEGPYFVAEADESDGSFLFLDPNVVIVTNIEADHLDHYGSLEAIEEAFCKLMASVPEQDGCLIVLFLDPNVVIVTNIEADHLDHYGSLEAIEEAFCKLMASVPEQDGCLIVCGENPRLPELARTCGRRVITYGFGAENDVVCVPVSDDAAGNAFEVVLPDGSRHGICLAHNPGAHNCLNATAVLALAYALGLPAEDAARAISGFSGVHRRFELVGDVAGVRVIDDYGHHPTEIAATLKAASGQGRSRVRVVFQPHRYSRTQALAADFGEAFADADEVFVMDVFSAGETPIPGVSGKTVAASVKSAHPEAAVTYMPNRTEVVRHLSTTSEPGDMIITMGAGDVTVLGPMIVEALEARGTDR